MSNTSEILFEYLRDVFFNASKATLDVEGLDEDFVMLGKGLIYFAQCFSQYNELALALATGDLSVPLPPPENELAAPLKNLHASLKHLTWQSQQVAMGDYKQRVDFMGEFSDAFNTMIEQLAERQQKLEDEIELSHNKTVALEQSNQLLTNITQQIPQQIIVVNRDTFEILFLNDSAQVEVDGDPEYVDRILRLLSGRADVKRGQCVEIQYEFDAEERYLSVNSYFLEWDKANAEAFVINDISLEKQQMKKLETYAYRDPMTHLYNRFWGMLTLNGWLDKKKPFALIFADLDNLKHINDKYGHNEGDKYIMCAAKHLKTFSPSAVISRIGGDEFMLLLPDICYDEACGCMSSICQALQTDEYLEGKDYYYSISFGIVAVGEDNDLSAGDILSLADERMYECKRMKKKNRKS